MSRKTKLFREKVSVFLYRRSEITEHGQKQYSADGFAFEPPRDKTNKMTVRPAKTQISLGIRPV